jgi:C-terminal peptidase prc
MGTPVAAAAAERVVYEDAIGRIDRHFLFIDTFDTGEALSDAAEAAEAAVPWLLAETDPDGSVRLEHGERGTVGRLAPVGGAYVDLTEALVSLEDQIVAASKLLDDDGTPYGLPDGVDLPVELLRGLSRALDRHSVVLSGDRLDRFDERISGKLQGIGARISRGGDVLLIEQVFLDGPADRGGVLAGDRVVRVDGVSTVGMSVSDTVDRIRGPEGSQVQLELEREIEGTWQTVVLVLTRDEVRIPNVRWEVEPEGTGYLEITHFSEQTTRLLRQALADFQVAGVRAILVDLRDNSGGSMIQSCQAADLFLDAGPVLRTAGRDGAPVARLVQKFESDSAESEPQVPVVVMVGPGSASASEILAGALMLRDRSVLVGARTHGKGTVQKLYTLRRDEDRARVRFKLTVARYLLPGDIPIETKVGLKADLEVDAFGFDQWAVHIPAPDADVGPRLVWANERPGWRDPGMSEERGDHVRTLAREVALRAGSAHRTDLLAAVDAVVADHSDEEDRLVVETFRYRGIDWQAADEPGMAPDVRVSLEVVDDPVAGDLVEIRALVENNGPAPLYRVRADVSATDTRLPWHGLTLPVGYVPPGETGMGRAVVRIDDDEPARRDDVSVVVHAHRRPSSEPDGSVLEIFSRPPPPLRTHARIRQGGVPEDLILEATFENLGARTLDDLRLKVGLQKGGPVELAVRHVDGSTLAPGEQQTFFFPLRSPDGRLVGPVPLQLRLSAARWGRVATIPIDLDVEGTRETRLPPEISGTVPLELPIGPHTVQLAVADELDLDDVTVWYDQDKVAWTSPVAGELALDVPVEVLPGTHRLVVRATDSHGVSKRRTWWIRGLEVADDAVVEGEATP